MKKEIWRPVPGYKGRYEISDLGNVKSLLTNRILKPGLTRGGYPFVNLSLDGKTELKRLNRLVAMTFPDICGEYSEDKQVHHLNHNCQDNRAVNLISLTTKEHSEQHRDNISKIRKANSIPVSCYTYEGEYVATYLSSVFAGEDLGVAHSSIRNATCGLAHSAAGYVWIEGYNVPISIAPSKTPQERNMEKGCKIVVKCSLDGNPICEYHSIADAARQNNIGHTAIGNCLKGRSKTCCGCKWIYKEKGVA